MGDISFLIFGVFFIVLGIICAVGKVYLKMDFWKKMSQEEKDSIAIDALFKNIGAMVFLCGLIFLAGGIWPAFRDHGFIWAMIAWFVGCGADAYYIEKAKRYKIPDTKKLEQNS